MSIGEGAGINTPYLLLDTGEVMTWVQCEGCDPCIESNYKSFDYKKSTSFQRMTVHDDLCLNPDLTYKGSCGFYAAYPNSSCAGLMGRDNFHFKNSKTQFMDVYRGLAFGCSLHSENVTFGNNKGPTNAITGIHGLAPGKLSFINQLDKEIKGVFSYCIPSWTEDEFTKSTIYFGDEAQIIGDSSKQVQVISMDTEVRYHLFVNGISVDGKRLPIDPSVFRLEPKYLTTGFIIDSGSPYTVLAKSAYDPFVDAITKFFDERYGWKPEPFDENHKVCYKNNYPEDDDGFPSVIFHFALKTRGTEVDMILNKDNVFMKYVGKGFCMMIFETDDPGPCIFGAFQQGNFKILYDVSNNLLRFVRQRCNDDTIH